MDLIGLRMFRLPTNHEWAIVSIGVAGLPDSNGQMSDLELKIRSGNAFPKADDHAMAQLLEFSGASVKDTSDESRESEYVASLDTEIKDGVATARTDSVALKTTMQRDIESISRGSLRGVAQVKEGVRESQVAGLKVAYVIRAWSPSLLGTARADDENLARDHALLNAPKPNNTKPPGKDAKSESPKLNEDW